MRSLKSLRLLVFLLIALFFSAPAWVNTTPNPYAKTDKVYAKARSVPLPQSISQQSNGFNQRSNLEVAYVKSEAPELSGGEYATGRNYDQTNIRSGNMPYVSRGKMFHIKQPSQLSMS